MKLIYFLSLFLLTNNGFADAKKLELVTVDSESHLNVSLMKHLIDLFKAEILVETGTFGGGTAIRASYLFKTVYTVELHREMYLKGVNNMRRYRNIRYFHDNSPHFLTEVIPQVKQKPIFWLDAHWCGGPDTAKAELNTPLIEELNSIKNSGLNNGVILVDDLRYCYRLQGDSSVYGNSADWPSCAEMKQKILEINENYSFYVLGDMAIAFLKDEPIEPSPLVKACTESRLFEATCFCPEILKAEKVIQDAYADREADVLYSIRENEGIVHTRCHILLWKGLLALGGRNFEDASYFFQKVLDGGYLNWRIYWYLAQTELGRNDFFAAKKHIQDLLILAPEFEEATELYQTITEGHGI